jgi:hypothetical protein
VYQTRTPGYSKNDPVKRWALPDRVFFACGACHVLVWAFFEQYPDQKATPLWISPKEGYIGSHIVVASDKWVFDYHGYSCREKYFKHTFAGAQRKWPGWHASPVELPVEVLVSEKLSRDYKGLWLREPDQFLHNALPRARSFLDRFQPPPKSS